jgi:hypothetical protein
MYMHKNVYIYKMLFFQYLHLFLFTIFSYLLSSLCVPYVVSFSRFSIFAFHFGILLRLFCKCGRYILILLDKCMLWWFHAIINNKYARCRSQHNSDDGVYCMWLITVSIYNLLLYFYIFSLCLHISRLMYVSVCTMKTWRRYLFNRIRRKLLMFMITAM